MSVRTRGARAPARAVDLLDALSRAGHALRLGVQGQGQQLTSGRPPPAARRRFLRSWAGDACAVAPPAALPAVALEAAPVLLPSALNAAAPSPPRSASPCCASQHCSPAPCWPAAAAPHVCCFSAPASPAGEAAGAAAVAARAVEAELRALRSARRAYQRAALGQHELADGLARSIGDALRRADDGCGKVPSRPQSAGLPDGGGRRKWQRNLAAELRGVCGRGGVDAALAGGM